MENIERDVIYMVRGKNPLEDQMFLNGSPVMFGQLLRDDSGEILFTLYRCGETKDAMNAIQISTGSLTTIYAGGHYKKARVKSVQLPGQCFLVVPKIDDAALVYTDMNHPGVILWIDPVNKDMGDVARKIARNYNLSAASDNPSGSRIFDDRGYHCEFSSEDAMWYLSRKNILLGYVRLEHRFGRLDNRPFYAVLNALTKKEKTQEDVDLEIKEAMRQKRYHSQRGMVKQLNEQGGLSRRTYQEHTDYVNPIYPNG